MALYDSQEPLSILLRKELFHRSSESAIFSSGFVLNLYSLVLLVLRLNHSTALKPNAEKRQLNWPKDLTK